MNVVDSSWWLSYFAGDANADFFAEPIQDSPRLIVPSITVYEVFKRFLLTRDETEAWQAAAFMRQGRVVDLDESIAIAAAGTAVGRKMPMADSVIYATALLHGATLWTQDADFKGLPEVKYIVAASARS